MDKVYHNVDFVNTHPVVLHRSYTNGSSHQQTRGMPIYHADPGYQQSFKNFLLICPLKSRISDEDSER